MIIKEYCRILRQYIPEVYEQLRLQPMTTFEILVKMEEEKKRKCLGVLEKKKKKKKEF